ncbi:toll/interleukin-1 receptor domain-containing protein [Enterococcus faecalis]|nr:toll/interleukin-1 receptor domain-containing protein [Enterococcus faecalis]EIT2199238.1 toll/interleukin-1 receptor domain-containing protein [Enterococcus faecalis]EKS9963112.1 toll/interleukin-1 receptor domain-containing protein [Enterococcus faecalis]
MSINSLQQKEKSLLSDITKLEGDYAREQKKIANSEKKIADSSKKINSSKSISTIKSQTRIKESETKKSLASKEKSATISSKLAKKRKELGDIQVKLSKQRTIENTHFQKNLKKTYDTQIMKIKETQTAALQNVQSELPNDSSLVNKTYDLFISYASDDSEYVDKLTQAFTNEGFSIWRDKSDITWGQSIRQSIDVGLSNSKFGLVVLSSKYIEKFWTNYELDGILNKESATGRQMILPLWHNITKDEIDKKSPSLSNRLALDTRINSTNDIINAFKSLLE